MGYISMQLKRSLVIARKNVKIYYLKGPVIVFGLIFPLFLFLAYSIGRSMPLKELLPGLIGMTVFFTATSVGPSIMPWEARFKTLERLLCCPVSIWSVILGDMLSSFIFGVVISMIPAFLTIIINIIDVLSFLMLFFSLILAAFCFSALSILLSAYPPTDVPATVMMLSSLIKFPLVFISGIFMPINQMPLLGKVIASFSPLTFFTDLLRHLILNNGYYLITLDFTMLIIFTLFFMIIAIKLHEKTMVKRLS
jgi:ABC-2 type transport system permease protein